MMSQALSGTLTKKPVRSKPHPGSKVFTHHDKANHTGLNTAGYSAEYTDKMHKGLRKSLMHDHSLSQHEAHAIAQTYTLIHDGRPSGSDLKGYDYSDNSYHREHGITVHVKLPSHKLSGVGHHQAHKIVIEYDKKVPTNTFQKKHD
jgi:hypothetical protein